jgi:hypothetical protein
MVHALQRAHSLLCPNSLLIAIHNLSVPHLIEVRSLEAVVKVGWAADSTDFESELAAFNALSQVVADGLFTIEDEQDFDYNIHVDSVQEMQKWLADWWEAAVVPENILKRIEQISEQAGHMSEIVFVVSSRMIMLKAV